MLRFSLALLSYPLATESFQKQYEECQRVAKSHFSHVRKLVSADGAPLEGQERGKLRCGTPAADRCCSLQARTKKQRACCSCDHLHLLDGRRYILFWPERARESEAESQDQSSPGDGDMTTRSSRRRHQSGLLIKVARISGGDAHSCTYAEDFARMDRNLLHCEARIAVVAGESVRARGCTARWNVCRITTLLHRCQRSPAGSCSGQALPKQLLSSRSLPLISRANRDADRAILTVSSRVQLWFVCGSYNCQKGGGHDSDRSQIAR